MLFRERKCKRLIGERRYTLPSGLACLGNLPLDVIKTAILPAVLVDAGPLIAIIQTSGDDHILGDALAQCTCEKCEQQLASTLVTSWAFDTQQTLQALI